MTPGLGWPPLIDAQVVLAGNHNTESLGWIMSDGPCPSQTPKFFKETSPDYVIL